METLHENTTDAVRRLVGDDAKVVACYLFGSEASGRAGAESDVDVAVLTREGLDAFEASEHVLRIKGRLEDALRRPVDVVHLNTADPVVQREVRLTGVMLCEGDRDSRIAWEVRSRKLWFDLQPRHRVYVRRMAERFREARRHG